MPRDAFLFIFLNCNSVAIGCYCALLLTGQPIRQHQKNSFRNQHHRHCNHEFGRFCFMVKHKHAQKHPRTATGNCKAQQQPLWDAPFFLYCRPLVCPTDKQGHKVDYNQICYTDTVHTNPSFQQVAANFFRDFQYTRNRPSFQWFFYRPAALAILSQYFYFFSRKAWLLPPSYSII